MSKLTEITKWEALELLAKEKGVVKDVWVKDAKEGAWKEITLAGVNIASLQSFISDSYKLYEYAAIKPKPIISDWTIKTAPKGLFLCATAKVTCASALFSHGIIQAL